jgi:hypothetical protein
MVYKQSCTSKAEFTLISCSQLDVDRNDTADWIKTAEKMGQLLCMPVSP